MRPAQSSTAPNTEDSGIGEATSKRICDHMNADHGASVYGMVLDALTSQEKRGKTVKNCKMTSISLESYTLEYVLCTNDTCEMREKTVPFVPPLKSTTESRPRLIALHHKVLTPKFQWLVTDLLALAIVIVCGLLALGTYGLGVEGMTEQIESARGLDKAISGIFGSASMFANIVRGSWYLSVTAHASEAFYVAYGCIKTLKLKPLSTVKWFWLVTCTGYPVTSRYLDFVKADQEGRAGKKAK